MLLEVKGLTKYFGGLAAVDKLDMAVEEGEIVGLIGPNGAGKTTVFNLITGVVRSTSGRVIFRGEDITGKKPHVIAKLGIGRTFQLNPLFGDLTVLQNVVVSFYLHMRRNLLEAYFNTSAYREEENRISLQSLEVLKLVGLEKMASQLARNLPHGFQKLLGIGRALAVRPKLLLLDEPLGGLAPHEVEFVMGTIRKIQAQGTAIVVVEHNMRVLEVCDRVVVINYGHKIAEGLPAEVINNKEVIEAYFGSEDAT